jgi:hypothetical protein
MEFSHSMVRITYFILQADNIYSQMVVSRLFGLPHGAHLKNGFLKNLDFSEPACYKNITDRVRKAPLTNPSIMPSTRV